MQCTFFICGYKLIKNQAHNTGYASFFPVVILEVIGPFLNGGTAAGSVARTRQR